MKVIHFISINKNFRIAGFLSAFLLVTLCGLTFLPVSFQDEHAEAATGTAAESTITLDVANSVASVDLTVNSSNGTFATSASNDEASFSVVTNNYTGYTLSISADDNTGELVNGEESLSSIESAISASTFDSSTYNGLWGYKPSKLNSTSNTNYLPSPTTEATTLDVTNSANNEANTYTIGLGARTDYTKPNGTYSKTFILTAVGNPISYTIIYETGDYYGHQATNMPFPDNNNTQVGNTTSSTVTLASNVPEIDNAEFVGWEKAGDESLYNPGDEIPINQISGSNSIRLSGVWRRTFSVSFANEIRTVYSQYSSPCPEMENNGVVTPSDWSLTTTAGRVDDYVIPTDVIPSISPECVAQSGRKYKFIRYEVYDPYDIDNANNYYWSYNQGSNSFSQPTIRFEIRNQNNNTWHSNLVLIPYFQLAVDINVTYVANDDSSNPASGIPDSYSQLVDINSTTTITVPTTSPTRNNYTFKGWTCSLPYTHPVCDGQTIVAGGTNISITTDNQDIAVTFTASWEADILSMQDMTLEQCTTEGIDVQDERDGEIYLVKKLADGKCWMLDNLRLDLGNATVLNNTTASNTNASAASLDYMKNGGGTIFDKYPTAKINNVAWTDGAQNYYSIPMTISTYKDQTTTSYGSGSGKIGVYYNFCAASAGSYCYGNGASSGTSSGNAEEDICPAGWRMPTGGSGEYKALYEAYSSNATNFRNALSTPLSGLFDNGSVVGYDYGGNFWSSKRASDSRMYNLQVYSSNVYADLYELSYRGNSVRCLLQ